MAWYTTVPVLNYKGKQIKVYAIYHEKYTINLELIILWQYVHWLKRDFCDVFININDKKRGENDSTPLLFNFLPSLNLRQVALW